MSKGRAPRFDAAAAIGQQTAANNAATRTNAAAANQFGPFGSATTQVDANGMPTGQTRSLSEPLQTAAGNVQSGVAQSSSWTPQQQFRLSDVQSAPQLGQAIYDQSMTYARGDMDRRRAQTEETLYNRGLRPGNEAYDKAMAPVLDAESRYAADAASRATMAGYDQRQREIGNALTERNQGYQDTSQGLSLLGAMNGLAPTATPLQQQQPVDAMGAYTNQYRSDLAGYQSQQQGWQNALRMGLGLATSPLTGPAGLGNSLLGMGMNSLFNSPAVQRER